MPRLLVPTLGALLLAALIGCGGGSSLDATTSATGATTSTTSTTSGDTGSTTARAPAGDYTLSFTGRGSTGSTFGGSGSGVVASDGTVTLDYASLEGGATATTTRRVVAAITAAGAASGTITVDGTSYALTSGALASGSNGAYTLTTSFARPLADTPFVETDTFALAPTRFAYAGPNSGFDDQSATYGGAGTATVVRGRALDLTYTSNRLLGGVSTTQTHKLSTTLLSGGTFGGTLNLAADFGSGGVNVPVTGTWSLSASHVLTLVLNYTNTRYASGTGRNPATSETLTLQRS